MPTFTPPTDDYLTRGDEYSETSADRLFRYYTPQQAGVTVWRDQQDVYHQHQFPWNGGMTNTIHDGSVTPNITTTTPGEPGLLDAKEVYLGGSEHIITQQQADDLTAAGYGAFITP